VRPDDVIQRLLSPFTDLEADAEPPIVIRNDLKVFISLF